MATQAKALRQAARKFLRTYREFFPRATPEELEQLQRAAYEEAPRIVAAGEMGTAIGRAAAAYADSILLQAIRESE